MIRIFIIILCLIVPLQENNLKSHDFIKGVYGNPGTLIEKGYSFSDLGMNAIFVRDFSLDSQLYYLSKRQGCKVFVEFPLLNGMEYLKNHPEAWPINQYGEPARQASWFMGICPTDQSFKSNRIEKLRSILTQYEPDGIWLDYVHWHANFETPEPLLPETCFCERCLEQFQEYSGIQIPPFDIAKKAEWILSNNDSTWRSWRASVLTEWVSDMDNIIEEMQPNALLGIFYCSWYPGDFNNALYRNLGLELEELSGIADVFSPMLFHKMMDKPTSWVSEYTRWLNNYLRMHSDTIPGIWPIVQAHNQPGIISPEEFREVMINGAREPSTGIMMFSDVSLHDDPDKIMVMKDLYLKHFRPE